MAGSGVGGWFQPPEFCSLSCSMVVSGPAMTSFLVPVFGGIFGEIIAWCLGSC
jgi:hypothetical protein